MGFLRPDDLGELRRIFAGITHDVRVELVSDDLDLRLLVDEVAGAAEGRIRVDKRAEADAPDREAPSMALSSDLLKGSARFLGLPVEYEMATFVGALATLGGAMGETFVSDATQARLDALATDVTLEVFSTPG